MAIFSLILIVTFNNTDFWTWISLSNVSKYGNVHELFNICILKERKVERSPFVFYHGYHSHYTSACNIWLHCEEWMVMGRRVLTVGDQSSNSGACGCDKSACLIAQSLRQTRNELRGRSRLQVKCAIFPTSSRSHIVHQTDPLS